MRPKKDAKKIGLFQDNINIKFYIKFIKDFSLLIKVLYIFYEIRGINYENI